MRGGSFLKRPFPILTDAARMELATNDEQLSAICADIEARLKAEGASIEQWTEYEELRQPFIDRMFNVTRAG